MYNKIKSFYTLFYKQKTDLCRKKGECFYFHNLFICIDEQYMYGSEFLPDILDSEKAQIREIAAQFAQNLWKVSFSEGLKAYVKSSEEIYFYPARWKYCFKCGEIDKKEAMAEHECALEFKDFPIVVQTSWYKLKEFFLTDRYSLLLKELGFDDLPLITPVSEPVKIDIDHKTRATAVEKEDL